MYNIIYNNGDMRIIILIMMKIRRCEVIYYCNVVVMVVVNLHFLYMKMCQQIVLNLSYLFVVNVVNVCHMKLNYAYI